MKEILGLMASILGAVTTIGSILFVLNMMQAGVRLSQGDASAASDMANTASAEIVSNLQWEIIKTVGIAIASALGLGALVKILKS